jgi:hypothetical protein
MSNYSLNNVRRFNFFLNEEDYYDMHLNEDDQGAYSFSGIELDNDCLVSYIDTDNDLCVSGNSLVSDSSYTYSNACSYGVDLQNIGLTGVDNGLIPFRRDLVTNEEFFNIYTNSRFTIDSDDLRLHLYAVSGATNQYDYPLSINEDKSIKLNGGFYQGFFRDKNTYSVLPSTLNNGDIWNLEFVLKKEDYEAESNKTLNDKHPENKGIFFYIGTRAENKWIYLYEKDKYNIESNYWNCDELEEDEEFDQLEDELDLSTKKFQTNNGFDLDSMDDAYIQTDNKFVLFDRTRFGLNTRNYKGDEVVQLEYKKGNTEKNLFLYMNRTLSGYTVHNIDKLLEEERESKGYTSLYKDLYNNALAFFIDDNGAIGYKYLVKDCDADNDGKYSILTGKSYDGIISESEWSKINIKIKASESVMKIYFYVNNKLKYVTSELPKLNLHKLDELDEKQEAVPYSISIGGGTQGLVETILPDYMCNINNEFPLETYFTGTFIGDFKSFKFYTC